MVDKKILARIRRMADRIDMIDVGQLELSERYIADLFSSKKFRKQSKELFEFLGNSVVEGIGTLPPGPLPIEEKTVPLNLDQHVSVFVQ